MVPCLHSPRKLNMQLFEITTSKPSHGYTEYEVQCHMVLQCHNSNFLDDILMNKQTNIVMDDG